LAFIGCDEAKVPNIQPRSLALQQCFNGVPPSAQERFWYEAGFRYITTRPGDWAITEVRKFIHYWRPWVDPRAYSAAVVVVSGVTFGGLLLLALLGIRSMPRSSTMFLIAVATGGTIAAVGWNVQLRYRFVIVDPVLIAAAALSVQRIVRWAYGLAVRRTSRVPGAAAT
jgi:hypothetical protein